MSTIEEQNIAIIRRLISELDSGNKDIIRELYSPDVVMHFPAPPPMGFDDVVALVDSVYGAFPDFRHHIEDIFGAGDKVVFRATDTGTHQHEYEGIAATGKRVTLTAMGIARIEDGQITELWEEVDMLGFMQQLGLELHPTAEAAAS